MISYWERTYFLEYDYLVVGAGLVGLSTALELKALRPQAEVLVLERGVLPTGATTKNAGFACFGSLTEILDDLSHMPQDEVLATVQMRWDGLQRLRARLGDAAMGLEPTGGYELVQPEWAHALDRMEEVNDLLQPIVGRRTYSLANELSSGFGFDTKAYAHLIENPLEAAVNTGQIVRGLMKLCGEQGITVLTGVEVTEVDSHTGQVHTAQGLTFRADQICLATNAFSKRFLPEADIQPGRGIVLVTQPIEGLRVRGIFHMDAGYFYFRHVGNRVLLGGGRNLYKEEETTTDFGLNPRIMEELHRRLREVILPGTAYEVDLAWAGIMAFGAVKKPIVQRIGPHLSCAVRMGGMGVAIGSEVGLKAAHIMVHG